MSVSVIIEKKPVHQQSRHRSLCALVLLCLSLYASNGLTQETTPAGSELTTKSATPIAIEADSAEQNEKLGLTIYAGNVSVTQGSLAIKADKVQIVSVTKAEQRNIEKIIATGEPAVFTHQSDQQDEQITAEARKIDYQLKDGIILLEDNASLVQHGSSVTGSRIEYFIQEQRVIAETRPNGQSERVRTVITPGEGSLFTKPEITE